MNQIENTHRKGQIMGRTRLTAILLGLAAVAAFTPQAWAVYHPTAARFLQRDPTGYADGMSLYEYTRSMPIGVADPAGLTAAPPAPPPLAPPAPAPTPTVPPGSPTTGGAVVGAGLKTAGLVGGTVIAGITISYLTDWATTGEALHQVLQKKAFREKEVAFQFAVNQLGLFLQQQARAELEKMKTDLKRKHRRRFRTCLQKGGRIFYRYDPMFRAYSRRVFGWRAILYISPDLYITVEEAEEALAIPRWWFATDRSGKEVRMPQPKRTHVTVSCLYRCEYKSNKPKGAGKVGEVSKVDPWPKQGHYRPTGREALTLRRISPFRIHGPVRLMSWDRIRAAITKLKGDLWDRFNRTHGRLNHL
jgi:hypothetical protein